MTQKILQSLLCYQENQKHKNSKLYVYDFEDLSTSFFTLFFIKSALISQPFPLIFCTPICIPIYLFYLIQGNLFGHLLVSHVQFHDQSNDLFCHE